MKKLIAPVMGLILVAGLVFSSLTAAQATDPITKLARRVNRLEHQVAALRHEVYVCETLSGPVRLTYQDGTYAFETVVSYAC